MSSECSCREKRGCRQCGNAGENLGITRRVWQDEKSVFTRATEGSAAPFSLVISSKELRRHGLHGLNREAAVSCGSRRYSHVAHIILNMHFAPCAKRGSEGAYFFSE